MNAIILRTLATMRETRKAFNAHLDIPLETLSPEDLTAWGIEADRLKREADLAESVFATIAADEIGRGYLVWQERAS
jgi:hypothetical protein